MASAPSQQTQSTQSSSSNDLFSRGFSAIGSRLKDASALSGGFENLISGVKNFLPTSKDLTITKIVESLMDPASASTSALAKTENYLFFDPRAASSSRGAPSSNGMQNRGPDGRPLASAQGPTFGQRRQGFSEAVVFMVGGGNMEEYGNLADWGRKVSSQGGVRRKVIYGSTDLVSADVFVGTELKRLGEES